MKMRLIFLIFICLSSKAKVPKGLPSFDSIISELRGPFEAKFLELPKNFIQDIRNNSATYVSNSDFKCNGKNIPAKEELAFIGLQSDLDEERKVLTEIGTFRGCNKGLEIREEFIYQGEDIKKTSFKKYLAGKINFSLFKYDSFKYRMKFSQSDLPFVTFESKKMDGGHFVVIKLYEQRIMTMRVKKLNDKDYDYLVTYYPYEVIRRFYQITVDIEQSTMLVRERDGKYFYFSSQLGQISEFDFASYFNDIIIQTALGSFSGTVKFALSGFPATQQISAGGQNSRLIDELNLAFVQLLNRDLERIRVLLLQYIEAAKNNLIIDQRPKE